MNRKLEIFESVLTSPFNNDSFVGFVREFLNNVELIAPTKYNKEYSNFSFYVDGYYHIGNYISDDNDKIAIFSVCLNRGDTVERARSMQRNFVKPLIEKGGCAGALVAFFTKDEPDKWRLSFIRMDYEFSMGKVKEKLTPAKRYSYLVGKGEPCHTAKQRLYPIFMDDNTNPGIDELEEAFSVEKVTNEFFNLYKEKYIQLKEYLEANEEFMNEAAYRNFTSEQFAKKLMGQIVFLYFIQKKGWLGVEAIPVTMTEKQYKNAFFARGTKSREIVPKVYAQQPDGTYRIVFSELQALSDEDEEFLAGIVKGKPWGSGPKDFMRKIFDGCIDARKNYFDDYLEPLFYTGLNKNRGENGFYAPLHRRIPFLNGGLFEQLDNYEWKNNNFAIPNELFSNKAEKGRDADGILDIFDRYNFTMNEDEPMEREVAIDPEMLGKVFENLLDVTDRKSKGAFYTPREIVHYMCQETLINHLVTKTGIPEADIRDFILYGDLMKDEDTTKDAREGNKDMLISANIYNPIAGVNRLKELDDILANVKVADLAVGSGAFPLGMLNEIVKARETLSAYMSIGMNAFQKKTFYAYDRKPYDLKANTIKNCIFACDIEPSAVDIAKLRLWLSIVIDDEITEDVGNGDFDAHSKPRQLPNLDCNIICGNSLVDVFRGQKLISESDAIGNVSVGYQRSIVSYGLEGMIARLIDLQGDLFFTKEHEEKEEIKKKIQKIYNDIILEQLQGNSEAIDEYNKTLSEPSKPFILWQLYFPRVFKEKGGFDIIIGNPPYGAELTDEVKKYCIQKYSDVHMRTVDSFNFFISLSLKLINNNGNISFIVPNNLLFQAEFEKTRALLMGHHLISVINLGDGVFNSAAVPTCIYVMKNDVMNGYEFSYSDFRNRELGEIIWNQVDMKLSSQDVLETDNKIIGISPEVVRIMKKISGKSVLLDELVADASYGITTGCDKAFIVNDNIIKSEQLESEYIHSTISGRDINKYIVYNTDKKVIYLPKTEGSNGTSNIQKHLNKYRDKLDKVSEVKKGIRPWWSNHRARNRELFWGEKIVLRQTGDTIIAAYDTTNIFTLDSVMNIKLKQGIDYKFILGCLNSSYYNFLYQNRAQESGRGFAQVKPQNVRALPIPKMGKNEQEKICHNVNLALEKKKQQQDADISSILKEIDTVLYDFFGLSKEEISLIERRN